jgi:hypothetical protein
VIVSVTTPSEESLPRNIEYFLQLQSVQRCQLWAKCLAIVITNPGLTAIRCQAPEEMALVNTLCWLLDDSKQMREQAKRGKASGYVSKKFIRKNWLWLSGEG